MGAITPKSKLGSVRIDNKTENMLATIYFVTLAALDYAMRLAWGPRITFLGTKA